MGSDRDPRLISRRRFLHISALGLGGLALAACNQGSTSTPASLTPGAEQPPTPEGAVEAPADATPAPEPTATPVVLGTGAQRLVYWHGLGGADGATLVTMLQQYASEQTEVTISSETYDWGVFYQKLPTATAAGTPPHMGTMHSWGIQQFSSQGILQDTDTLFFEAGLLPRDDFNQALMEQISIDGKAQAVPFDYHGWINWVNTRVIENAGLDPDALPQNGEEFVEWALQVVTDEEGRHPNEDGFDPDHVAVWANHTAWHKFTLGSVFKQFGGGIISDDGQTSLLGAPETMAAAQYWADLIFEHRVIPPAVPGIAGPMDLFATDAIAMAWDGTWNLNFFRDNPEAQEVMRPMPLNSVAPDGRQAARFDSHMMVIPTGVADPDLTAAKDLIVWLSNNGETWATSGQVPARTSVQQLPSVQEIESVKVAAAQFEEFGVPGEAHPAINEILAAYEPQIIALTAGTTPVEEAMNEAHAAVQAILDRF